MKEIPTNLNSSITPFCQLQNCLLFCRISLSFSPQTHYNLQSVYGAGTHLGSKGKHPTKGTSPQGFKGAVVVLRLARVPSSPLTSLISTNKMGAVMQMREPKVLK